MRARPDEPLATWCQVGAEGCAGRAVHRHHILRRSRGGDDSPENTSDVCAMCHDRIHANPAWAYERGLLRRGTR